VGKDELNELSGVPLSTRYQSAWSEVNARILSRQSAFGSYVLAIGGLIALLCRDYETAFVLSWLPAVVTISFIPWMLQNSIVIELLSRFCDACDAYGLEPAGPKRDGVPCWHSQKQNWYAEASKTRGSIDWSLILLAAVCVAFSLAVNLYEIVITVKYNLAVARILIAIPSVLVGTSLGICSIVLVVRHSRLRKEMRTGIWKFERIGNEWKFSRTCGPDA
jgi:hypothetical protein